MPLKTLIPIKKLMAQSVTPVTKDYIDTDKEVYFILQGQSQDWVFTFLKIKNVY